MQQIYLIRPIYLYIYQMQAGVVSGKFVAINQLNHRFPEDIRSLKMKTTLLHNHSHAAAGSYLVFHDSFNFSTYMAEDKLASYFPCSWFLQNGKVRAYEFCDEPIEFDIAQVEQNLKLIESKGYSCYGTTVRPVRNFNQFMTKTGHAYIPLNQIKQKENYSETAIDGESMDKCVEECVQTGIQHADYHQFYPDN